MIYLASPYSHSDPAVREQRFRDVCRVTAQLLRDGMLVFSPIVHCHPLVEFNLPTDWSFWEVYDLTMLKLCDGLVVLMLKGWTESKGVQREVAEANKLKLPIRYIFQDGTFIN